MNYRYTSTDTIFRVGLSTFNAAHSSGIYINITKVFNNLPIGRASRSVFREIHTTWKCIRSAQNIQTLNLQPPRITAEGILCVSTRMYW